MYAGNKVVQWRAGILPQLRQAAEGLRARAGARRTCGRSLPQPRRNVAQTRYAHRYIGGSVAVAAGRSVGIHLLGLPLGIGNGLQSHYRSVQLPCPSLLSRCAHQPYEGNRRHAYAGGKCSRTTRKLRHRVPQRKFCLRNREASAAQCLVHGTPRHRYRPRRAVGWGQKHYCQTRRTLLGHL